MPRKSSRTVWTRSEDGLLTRADVPRSSNRLYRKGFKTVTVDMRPRTLGVRYSRTRYGALLGKLPFRGINIRRK